MAYGAHAVPFFQQEDLCTRLNNILQDYPAGTSVLKEFIQNADDAGATVVSVAVDAKHHPTSTLLSDGLSAWHGPSVLIHNNAVFTERDFDGICRLGASVKANDSGSVGRYGLGFNSAYHLTDVVQFVSADSLILFDPHRKFLPDGLPGMRLNFLKSNLANEFPDQVAPFIDGPWGCNMEEHYHGTLFRLPFRTADCAQSSAISNARYTAASAASLVEELTRVAEELLLFLQNVEEIRVYSREEGGEYTRLCSTRIKNMTPELRSSRRLLKCTERDFHFDILEIETEGGVGVGRWVVGSYVTTKGETRAVLGVAARVDEEGRGVAVKGKLYCFLPLPITTGLPVHVNGSFYLASSRRDIIHNGPDVERESTQAMRAEWNESLLEDDLPHLYTRLVQLPTKELWMKPTAGYQWWPVKEAAHTGYEGLAQRTLDLICKAATLWTMSGGWVPLKNVVIETETFAAHAGDGMRRILAAANLHLAEVPVHILRTLSGSGMEVKCTTPRLVSDALHKQKSISRRVADEALAFILVDWDPERGVTPSQTASAFSLLDGLPLIPLTGGKLGTFQRVDVHGKGKGKKARKADMYYVCGKDESFSRLVLSSNSLVDPDSPSYTKLQCAERVGCGMNIAKLNLEAVVECIPKVLPPSWYEASCRMVTPSPAGGKCDWQMATRVASAPFIKLRNRDDRKKVTCHCFTTAALAVLSVVGVAEARDPPGLPLLEAEWARCVDYLRLLWRFLEDYKPNDLQLLAKWPIVPTQQGYVVSVDYATTRCLVNPDVVPSTDLPLLEEFGCLVAEPCVVQAGVAKDILSTRKNLIYALSWTAADSDTSNSSREVLRDRVIEWARHRTCDAKSSVTALLPIFRTLKGSMVAARTRMASGATAPSHSCLPADGVWHDLLRESMADSLLLVSPETKPAFELAELSIPSETDFVATYLCSRLPDLPIAVSTEFMRFCGRVEPWRKGASHAMLALRQCCRSTALVEVTESGGVLPPGRYPLSEFTDPTDPYIRRLFGTSPRALPDYVLNDPEAIKCARASCQLLTLSNFSFALQVAQDVAAAKDIEKGECLLQFLEGLPASSWTAQEWAQLKKVPFVPCPDLRDCLFPHGVCPNTRVISPPEKGRGKKGRRQLRAQRNNSSAQQHLQDELDGAQDAEEEMWDEVPAGAKPAPDIGFNLVHQHWKDVTCGHSSHRTVFTSLAEGLHPDYAWLGWKRFPVLPDEVARIGGNHATAPRPEEVVQNLLSAVKQWQGKDFPVPLAQGTIMLALAFLCNHTLPTAQHKRLLTPLMIHPIIVCDDGDFVYPRQVYTELEVDVNRCVRAPPTYLMPLRGMLRDLGSPAALDDAPQIYVRSQPQRLKVADIHDSFRQGYLTDFTIHTAGGKSIKTHRLVLALGSPFFATMFSSGLQDEPFMVLDIHYDAVYAAVTYLYCAELDLGTPTNETIATACNLLAISDMWMLPHLTELIEVWMAVPDVVTTANVCSLAQYAHAHNARQLLHLCQHVTQSMFAVVRELTEYQNLPEELRGTLVEPLVKATKKRGGKGR